jgi:prophage antirepressor-like protein
MKEIMLFKNSEFGKIRIASIEGDPYFCASDVCKGLGYSNPRDAVIRYCKGVEKLDTPTDGGNQILSYISERDLYRLAIHSRAEKAEQFQDWITDDVLPSIRRTGGYIAGQESMDDDQLLEQAVLVAQRRIAERDAQIAELEPKAEFYDQIMESHGCVNVDDAAKTLNIKGIGPLKLREYLRNEEIFMTDNIPYQRYIEAGYFRVDTRSWKPKNNDPIIYQVTMVTPKGLDYLRKRIGH